MKLIVDITFYNTELSEIRRYSNMKMYSVRTMKT